MRKFLLLMVCLVALGGCEALLGSVATIGGTYVIGALKEDADANIAWREKQKELVANIVTGMQMQCRNQEAPDMTSALGCYQKLLDFHADQLPEILVERLAKRARAAKARLKAVVPDPQMMEPTAPQEKK